MVEREFVNENIFRTKMFISGIPSLKKELIKEKSRPLTPFRKRLVEDTIYILKNVASRGDFNYFDAFIFQVCFSSEFERIKVMLSNGEYDISKDFQREDYWRNEDIQYIDALYFSYPYLFQSYQTEISIDMKKLNESLENVLKNKNINLVSKAYIDFVKKIDKKS